MSFPAGAASSDMGSMMGGKPVYARQAILLTGIELWCKTGVLSVSVGQKAPTEITDGVPNSHPPHGNDRKKDNQHV